MLLHREKETRICTNKNRRLIKILFILLQQTFVKISDPDTSGVSKYFFSFYTDSHNNKKT